MWPSQRACSIVCGPRRTLIATLQYYLGISFITAPGFPTTSLVQ